MSTSKQLSTDFFDGNLAEIMMMKITQQNKIREQNKTKSLFFNKAEPSQILNNAAFWRFLLKWL